MNLLLSPIKGQQGEISQYNLKIGQYEIDFNERFDDYTIEGKISRTMSVLHDRIEKEYIFDENTQTFLSRPKQPNVFQRIFGR